MSQQRSRRLENILGHLRGGGVSASPCGGTGGLAALGGDGGGKGFRYTLPESAPLLSPAEREFYEENGFFVARKLVSGADLEAYKDRFKQICRKEVQVKPTWQ